MESNQIAIVKKEIAAKEKQWMQQSGLSLSDFQKEASFALQHIDKNPYLLKCTQNSIIKSVMNLAQTGLTLNPVSKYAYLVPRSVNGALECVLDPSYQGLVKLLTDSGIVGSIDSHVVYKGDLIDFDYSSEKKVNKHVPYFLTGNEKGGIVAAYSIAKLDSGFHAEIMSASEIEEIRNGSESYKAYKAGKIKSCVWTQYPSEMCRKTVIKRHFKYLPKSGKLDRFNLAVQADDYANGYDEPVGVASVSYIESLIDSSTLPPELKAQKQDEMMELEYQSQANRMIKYLQQHQGDPRDNLHSQKQVNKAIDNAMASDR